MILKFLYGLFIILLISIPLDGFKRHINCSLISSPTDSNVKVIHVIASGSDDVIHFLWSSYKVPSVIVARTTNDTEVKCDLQKLQALQMGAISFSKSPLASIGFTISELFQFSYKDDTADINDAVNITSLGLDTFSWNQSSYENFRCTDNVAYIALNSFGEDEIFSKNGTFQIQFSAIGKEEPAGEFPHLMYSGNSTQIQIAMDNLYSESKRVRYGLQVMMFSHLNCDKMECQEKKTKSVSDEMSPGIFTDIDLLPPCIGKDNNKGSFLTWRPVSYNSKEPSVANSSDAKMTSECLVAPFTDHSIAELYYHSLKTYSSMKFNFTFGTNGDGFYAKTLYSQWSLMVGTGVPVHTTVSVAAVVFISVGLGALALFLISGGVFFTVRLCRKKDDDLLLSESNVN